MKDGEKLTFPEMISYDDTKTHPKYFYDFIRLTREITAKL